MDVLPPSFRSIDVFVLDVEGAEMLILEQFPFDQVSVKVWIVETDKTDREKFMTFMKERSYHCWHRDIVNSVCVHTKS